MPHIYRLENVPSSETYVRGLAIIQPNMNDVQVGCLLAQYAAPKRTVTVPQLASLANVRGGYPTVNAQYGRLGRMLCEATGIEPDMRESGVPRWWAMWSQGWEGESGFRWQMLPEVAEALEALGWVSEGEARLPEEYVAGDSFREGSVKRIVVNAYERNPQARRACIERYGYDCAVCGFNFGSVYGDIGEGYIHVHHLTDLATIGGEYQVNPETDLRPVCPNCHAMLHTTVPAMSIEDLQRLLNAGNVG